MSYYTFFSIEVYNSLSDILAEKKCINDTNKIMFPIARKLNSLLKMNCANDIDKFEKNGSITYDAVNQIILSDPMEWDNYEEDMIALSKEFPNLFFLLLANGEDVDDEWRVYTHNGNYYEAAIFKTFIPPRLEDLL